MKNQKMFLGVGVYNPLEHKNDNFYIDKNVPRFGSSNDGKPVVGEYNINEAELKVNKKQEYQLLSKNVEVYLK